MRSGITQFYSMLAEASNGGLINAIELAGMYTSFVIFNSTRIFFISLSG
jgi:hypothetical protein